jgi:hypothetical protein
MGDETVRVLVRCRPMNSREKGLGCATVVEMDEPTGLVRLKRPGNEEPGSAAAAEPPKQFTFDGAYFVDSNSEQIYEEMVFPLVEGVLEGYNGTVFAYGQTGCGKSFTMEGIPEPKCHRGITPRSFEHIFQAASLREGFPFFSKKRERERELRHQILYPSPFFLFFFFPCLACFFLSQGTKFLIRASYLEIYNEQIRDLLTTQMSEARLELKEHPDRGVYVKDLTQHEVANMSNIITLMARGSGNRHVGATAMNADSSRSHSIFTVVVEMAETRADGQVTANTTHTHARKRKKKRRRGKEERKNKKKGRGKPAPFSRGGGEKVLCLFTAFPAKNK